MSVRKTIVGIALALTGWIFAIVTCVLPMWKVTAFIGANIITVQTIWEGLWMNCVVQSTGHFQCKDYNSALALPSDLQAGRIMTVLSILTALLALTLSLTGTQCSSYNKDKALKAKVLIISGVLFIVAGMLVLIPVSWASNSIIQDFYNPLLSSAQRRELGTALYMGFAAAALLITGGAVLCCRRPSKERMSNPPNGLGQEGRCLNRLQTSDLLI